MTKAITNILFGFVLVLSACSSSNQNFRVVFENPELFSHAEGKLTDVITYDVFSPPVATRIYAYSTLAAYEVMAIESSRYGSLRRIMKDFEPIPLPEKPINIELASLLSFAKVGQALTFSKDSTQLIIDEFIELANKHRMPSDILKNSIEYADVVCDKILEWSEQDNYKQTRSAVKYTVKNTDESRWVPTPPAYMQAVEPNWMNVRTVMIDSASQFLPAPPSYFTTDKNSDFYKLAMELYDKGNSMTEEQIAMSDFWDCNPYKINTTGHMMYATKALSPGGHWMGVAGIICRNKKADFETTVYTYTATAFALMDAFISCWNTKYHYNLLRPETYINRYIDNTWEPYLQTPPFPEYTSGHSVISNAAATILTNIFGEDTPFLDTTQRLWGWPDRMFESVNEAAWEAAESRIYGGIHYREAVEAGFQEGKEIGDFVYAKLQTAVLK